MHCGREIEMKRSVIRRGGPPRCEESAISHASLRILVHPRYLYGLTNDAIKLTDGAKADPPSYNGRARITPKTGHLGVQMAPYSSSWRPASFVLLPILSIFISHFRLTRIRFPMRHFISVALKEGIPVRYRIDKWAMPEKLIAKREK